MFCLKRELTFHTQIILTRDGVGWNNEEREVSSVAIQQGCRPLYGKQFDDYKEALGTDARGPNHRALP